MKSSLVWLQYNATLSLMPVVWIMSTTRCILHSTVTSCSTLTSNITEASNKIQMGQHNKDAFITIMKMIRAYTHHLKKQSLLWRGWTHNKRHLSDSAVTQLIVFNTFSFRQEPIYVLYYYLWVFSDTFGQTWLIILKARSISIALCFRALHIDLLLLLLKTSEKRRDPGWYEDALLIVLLKGKR